MVCGQGRGGGGGGGGGGECVARVTDLATRSVTLQGFAREVRPAGADLLGSSGRVAEQPGFLAPVPDTIAAHERCDLNIFPRLPDVRRAPEVAHKNICEQARLCCSLSRRASKRTIKGSSRV